MSCINFFFGKLLGLYIEVYMRERAHVGATQKLINVGSYQSCRNSHKPSFLSSAAIFTFVSVISLKEARKSTTSPFSFFIGTISSRHQNEDPARIKNEFNSNSCLLAERRKKKKKISELLNLQLM